MKELKNNIYSRGWVGDQTPLHLAIRFGYFGEAEDIIKTKIGLDAKKDNGDTPLHSAIYYEETKIAKLLINAGADLDAKDDAGDTALHRAVSHENIEVAEALIKAGAKINIRNSDADTPLDLANNVARMFDGKNKKERKEMISLLKRNGAETSKKSEKKKAKEKKQKVLLEKVFNVPNPCDRGNNGHSRRGA